MAGHHLTAAAVRRVCRPRVPHDEARGAIAEFEAAVDPARLAPDVPPAWPLFVAGHLAEDLGDWAEALRLQERAIAHGGDDTGDLARRAYLLVKAGRDAEGRAAFDALRERLTELPEAAVLFVEMEGAGLAEVALEWIDAAVAAPGDDMTRPLLLAHRRRLRTDLGLPLDALDRSAVPIFIEGRG